MGNIIEKKVKGYGGVCGWKCEVVKVSNVVEFPEREGYSLTSSPLLATGEEWHTLYFVEETPFPAEQLNFRGGGRYDFRLEGVITKPDYERASAISAFIDEHLILKFTDQNGSTYIVGNLEEPVLMVMPNRTWNRRRGDRYEAEVVLNWSGRKPVLELIV